MPFPSKKEFQNAEWLAAKAIQLARSKTPVPVNYPESIRVQLNDMILLELKKGTVPEEPGGPISDAVKKAYEIPIKKEGDTRLPPLKPLPPPSTIQGQTIPDGVPIARTHFPWKTVAYVANHFIEEPKLKMDDSQAREDLLNASMARAYPNLVISPVMAFWLDVTGFFSPLIVYVVLNFKKISAKIKETFGGLFGKKPEKKPEEVKA